MDKKQKFHVVQLALFNANVLSEMQKAADRDENSEISKILNKCAKLTVAGIPPMPSTVNQSIYFGMAYMTLVWLRESLNNYEVESALSSKHMDGIWDNIKIEGERDVSKNYQKLRLIRNALSHGNVEIDDNFIFKFSDIDNYKKEIDYTHIYMSNINLGELTLYFYYAVSDVLYKK